MNVEGDIINLLIDPILSKSLDAPIDDFVLHTKEGPVSLAATLTVDTEEHDFYLHVRDSQGRDLRSFFTSSSSVTVEDTLSASGVIGGRVRLEFGKIWPPSWSQTRPIGDVRASSARLKPGEIRIPPSTADRRTTQETRQLLQSLNPAKELAPLAEEHLLDYEHIAIFSDVKLQFKNSGSNWKEEHPFWGERSGTKFSSWDGDALEGRYSIRQSGNHLEIGFRHTGESDNEAKLRFKSLLRAVAFTQGIFPWPTFIQRRQNGSVTEQNLRFIKQQQGSIFPLRECDGFSDPTCPTHLIAAIAAYIQDLPQEKLSKFVDAMWVFRGADSREAPAP